MTRSASKQLECDVAIVGAGAVGLSLALALDVAGVTSVVVARDNAPTNKTKDFDGRAYSIALGCWRMWETLGLTEALADGAEPVVKVSAGAGNGPSIVFDQDDLDEFDDPLGYMVEAHALNYALWKAAKAAENVTVLSRTKLQDFEVNPADVTLTAGGRLISASLLVGCDGRGSVVRKKSGVKYTGHDYDATGMVATVTLKTPHDGVARQKFLPSGPFAVLPLTENRANLIWSERNAVAETMMAMGQKDFEAELNARVGDFLGDFTTLGPRFAYPLIMRIADSFIAPRIALAGDAAHAIHPLAGQGLNLGLRDVAALVDTIKEAQTCGLDIGSEIALQPYEAARRTDTVTMSTGMSALNALFKAPAPVRAVSDLGMKLAGKSSLLRRAFTREAAGLSGDIAALFRGEDITPG